MEFSLILNQFRSDDLAVKLTEEPHEDVLRQLRQQNTLLLRTADLYAAISRKLAGEDVAQEIIDALAGGGGWLKVSEESVEFVQFSG